MTDPVRWAWRALGPDAQGAGPLTEGGDLCGVAALRGDVLPRPSYAVCDPIREHPAVDPHTITGNAAGRGRRIRRSLGTPTAEVKVLKPQRWHA